MSTTYEIKRQELDEATDRAAQLHNAQLNANFKILLETENRQWEAIKNNSARMSATLAPTRPVEQAAPVQTQQYTKVEQKPVVTEYTHTVPDLFRSQTMEKVLSRSAAEIAMPTAEVYTAPVNEVAPVETAAVEMEEQYGLSAFAKKILIAFCATVTVMTAIIGINSNIIRQKNININQLEQKRQELLEENAEIQARIERAQSEETIRQFAESHGMVMGN
jgi:cell division protein FtsL